MKEQIVLLHGITCSSYHMRKIKNFLERNHYQVFNLDYPSTKLSLANLVEFLHEKIKKFTHTKSKINFVGFSMGGLLARMYLNQYSIKNLGKVIQLAPPNQGSEIADFFKKFNFYKKIFGVAGQELITDQKNIQNLLKDKINYPLGIIAGTLCLNPIFYFFLPRPHDGKVSVESTKLKQMKSHILIKKTHISLLNSKKVHQYILNFIRIEKFR